MVDLLIKNLKKIGYPIFLQGSILADEPYPDSFFTFWNNTTESQGFYDNNESAIKWVYTIAFYSTNPITVNTVLLTAKQLLKNEGFIISGNGFDVLSDEKTHTGRGLTVQYLQTKKEELREIF